MINKFTLKNMIAIKSIIAVFMLAFTLTQCNAQTKKSKTMETTKETQADTKEIIVDVRTIEEWNEDGHADCTVNYPMDIFESKIEELKKYDKVIIVCRSGSRAGIAKDKLRKAGYTKEIENLGSWKNITCKTK
jgi:rhodanese-related sulfurtransferase